MTYLVNGRAIFKCILQMKNSGSYIYSARIERMDVSESWYYAIYEYESTKIAQN